MNRFIRDFGYFRLVIFFKKFFVNGVGCLKNSEIKIVGNLLFCNK